MPGPSPAALLAAVVTVPGGEHRPFYPSEGQETVQVEAFDMDATPVTVGEYRAFLEQSPAWRKGAVKSLFADQHYLARWAGPADPGALDPASPATQVSWHAARAYCESRGGRLPTVTEWEYAADATADAPHGARSDPRVLQRILAWYARGDVVPGPVGRDTPTVYGLHDQHGLVWEWTEDFNSLLIAADTRESGEQDRLRFCGAGAVSAIDPADYASFMRFAFRSSLTASSTTQDLGFRCVYPASP